MACTTLLLLALLGQVQQPAQDPAALVKKLGASAHAGRDVEKTLEDLGSKALPELRAALKTDDAEVRSRAGALIDKIEGTLLLKGTYVRLDFKNATIQEIVDSLADQAGYEIWLARARTAPDSEPRRFTLREREPILIWQAIEKVCQAGRLTCNYQDTVSRRLGQSEPGLVLYDQQNGLLKPTCSHGPFQFSVVALSYDSQLSYDRPALSAPLPGGGAAIKGMTRKSMAPGKESARARTRGSSGLSKSESEPPRTVHFQIGILVSPEPRIAGLQIGTVQLREAVDDQNNSLVAPTSDEQPAFGQGNMPMPMFNSNMVVSLRRPERPGKRIKTVRGTVEVQALAARPDPLVIPLEGTAGKTFESTDKRLIVTSVETSEVDGPLGPSAKIELTFDNLNDLIPQPSDTNRNSMAGMRAEMARGMRMGMGPGGMGGGLAGTYGILQKLVQVISTKGRRLPCRTALDQRSRRLSITTVQAPDQGSPKEIRIFSPLQIQSSIPFEFHDLPMP